MPVLTGTVRTRTGKRERASTRTGKDASPDRRYVCPAGGWTGCGELPDECPRCKTKKDKSLFL